MPVSTRATTRHRAGRAARAGLAIATAGIILVGGTGGTAYAGLGQRTRPAPDGGSAVKTHGVKAAPGATRKAGISPAAKAPAKPKSPKKAKAAQKAKVKAKTKTKAKAVKPAPPKHPAPAGAAPAAAATPPTAGAAAVTPTAGAAAVTPTPTQVSVSSLTAPTGVQVHPLNGGIRVSWTAGTGAHHSTAAATGGSGTCSTTGTTCDITTGVSSGQTYNVLVTAWVDAGESDSAQADPSGPVTVGPPAAPTAVTATGSAPTALKVAWTADSDTAGIVDHYVATAVQDPGKSCTSTTTSCDVTGLTQGTTYTFKVTAIGSGDAGDSAESAPSTGVAPGPPDAPTAVQAAATGPFTAAVSWTAPATRRAGVARYVVTAVQEPSLGCETQDAATTTCDVQGLENGVPGYTFTVLAKGIGGSGDSSPSAASSPATVAGPPDRPTALIVTPGDQKLDVAWTNPANTGAGVARLQVELVSDAGRNCGVVASSAQTCSITGLVNGTAYVVRIRAVGTGATGDSDWVEAGPAKPSIAPGTPTALTATAGIESIVAAWTKGTAGSGIAKFEVYATSAGTSFGSCETADGTGTTCTVTGLTAGTEYTVAVRAYGIHGLVSDWSAGLTRTPAAVTVPATVPPGAGAVGSTSGDAIAPGEAVTLSGSGFAPNSTIKIAIYSTPVVLGTTTTDGSGAFSVQVTIPAGYSGSHTLVAAGINPDGTARFLTLPVTVTTSGGGTLPVTGDRTGSLSLLGFGLLIGGIALVAVSRQRRHPLAG